MNAPIKGIDSLSEGVLVQLTRLEILMSHHQNMVRGLLQSKDFRVLRRWYMHQVRQKSWREISILGENPGVFREALEGFEAYYRLNKGKNELQKPLVSSIGGSTGRIIGDTDMLPFSGDAVGTHTDDAVETFSVEPGYMSREAIVDNASLATFLQQEIDKIKERFLRSNPGSNPWQFIIDSYITIWNKGHPKDKLYRYGALPKHKAGKLWNMHYQVRTREDFEELFGIKIPRKPGSRSAKSYHNGGALQQMDHAEALDKTIAGTECVAMSLGVSQVCKAILVNPTGANPAQEEAVVGNLHDKGGAMPQPREAADIDSMSETPSRRDIAGNNDRTGGSPGRKKSEDIQEVSREQKIDIFRDARAVFDSVFLSALSAYKKEKNVPWNPEEFLGIPTSQEGVTIELKGRDIYIDMRSVILKEAQAVFWTAITRKGVVSYITKESPKNPHNTSYQELKGTFTIILGTYTIRLYLPKIDTGESVPQRKILDETDEFGKMKYTFMGILSTYIAWYIAKFPHVGRSSDFTLGHLPSFTWKMQRNESSYEFDIFYQNRPPNSDAMKVHEALLKTKEIEVFSASMQEAGIVKGFSEEGKKTGIVEYRLPGRTYRLHLRTLSE